jgi:4-amino-4-deoxy-L-arabinose transferase-like glycosyltransferase
LYGAAAGVGTLFLLASFAPLYGNGKSVLGEIPGLLFLVVGLLFLQRVEQGDYKPLRNGFLAGLMLGLSISTKPIFILILPALALMLVVKFSVWKRQWKAIIFGIFGCAGAVVVWILTQFHGERSFTRIIGHYTNPYSLPSIWSVVQTNVLRFFFRDHPCSFSLVVFDVWWISCL